MMEMLDREYPGYGFAAHKGYGTPGASPGAATALARRRCIAMSFPVMHELQGEYSALHALEDAARGGAHARCPRGELETTLSRSRGRARGTGLQKLRLLVAVAGK